MVKQEDSPHFLVLRLTIKQGQPSQLILEPSLLLFKFFFLIILCKWMYVSVPHVVLNDHRNQKMVSDPRNCKPLWILESNLGALEEQPIVVPTEPDLQPTSINFRKLLDKWLLAVFLTIAKKNGNIQMFVSILKYTGE